MFLSSTGSITMTRTTGGHLLCLLLLSSPLSLAEDAKKDERRADNNVTAWGQAKTRRLFARPKISSGEQTHISLFQRHKPHIMTPARRCGRLMESCSTHLPCCDPCASCRCRLFNTICHCWRMNPLCLRRT